MRPVRRLVLLSALLLGIDQLTKTIAQLSFGATDLAAWNACRDAGLNCVQTLADVVLAPGLGLMYTVHPGLYWWPDHPLLIAGLHATVLAVWVGVMTAAVWYRRRYRPSLAVDLAAASFTAAAWGNLIDRLLVGGARDWLATPWWIANFADVAGWLVLPLLAVELWRHPPSRRLLQPGQLPLRSRRTPAA